MSTRVLAVLAAAVCALAASEPAATDPLPSPAEVFVLVGQSNMLGRGFPVSAGEASDTRVLVWRPVNDQGWTVAQDPLGDPADPANGVGPGMTFAKHLAAAGAPSVGLVQCAKGGTSIAKWQSTGDLYRRCLRQITATGGRVTGVLFLQGESDAQTATSAAAWGAGFAAVASALERDLTIAPASILLGQIGRLPAGYPFQAQLRRAQQTTAARLGMRLIPSLDLPMQTGQPHFTVAGYRTLGARFASAWLAQCAATHPTAGLSC